MDKVRRWDDDHRCYSHLYFSCHLPTPLASSEALFACFSLLAISTTCPVTLAADISWRRMTLNITNTYKLEGGQRQSRRKLGHLNALMKTKRDSTLSDMGCLRETRTRCPALHLYRAVFSTRKLWSTEGSNKLFSNSKICLRRNYLAEMKRH